MFRWNLNVSYDTSSNKTVFQRTQLWVFLWIYNLNIQEFNIQVLIYTVQCPRHYDIILQLDGNLLSNERLEEGIENLERKIVRYADQKVSNAMKPHKATHHD